MKTIWLMAIKDLRLIARDRMSLFFILGFPVLMGLFFGLIMGGPSNGGTSSMDLAIVDEDRSDISQKFTDRLGEIDVIELHALARDEAMERVRKGKLVGMIAIPEGFGETAGLPWKDAPTIQVGMDPSRNAEAAMTQGFVMQSMGQLFGDRLFSADAMRPMVKDLRSDLAQQSEEMSPDLQEAYSLLTDSLDGLFDSLDEIDAIDEPNEPENARPDEGGSELAVEKANPSNAPSFEFANIESIDVTRQLEKGSRGELLTKIRSKWDIAFPQAMVWSILGCVAGFSVSIVRERARGTFQRLEVAPITRFQVLMGKGLACFLAVFIVLCVLCAFGYLLGLRARSPGLLVLSAAVIAFCFVGVMLVMSVLGKTEEAVGGAGWGINMIMAMFGGGMVPLMFLPGFMKPLSRLSPVSWAVLSLEGAIWRGFSLGEFIVPFSVLLAVGVAGMAFGTYRLSRE